MNTITKISPDDPTWAERFRPNLLVKELQPGKYQIIFPPSTEEGATLTKEQEASAKEETKKEKKDNHLMMWPVNPHTTGFQAVAAILHKHPKLTNATFVQSIE